MQSVGILVGSDILDIHVLPLYRTVCESEI